MVPETFLYVGNTSNRKDLVISSGSFDEDFPTDAWEDFEFSQRLEKFNVRAQYLPGVDCVHDHHVKFGERLLKMSAAAEGALIMERKYNGTFPWKALTRKSSRELWSETARMLMVHALTRKRERALHLLQKCLRCSIRSGTPPPVRKALAFVC